MPPLPRLKLGLLAPIEAKAAALPRAGVVAVVQRIETLAAELNPAQVYPADWLVFRLLDQSTPDAAASQVAGGEAIITDLSTLAERLCAAAGVTEADVAGPLLHADEVCKAWNVSRQTLTRWRKVGLVAWRVQTRAGRAALCFREASLKVFEAAHSELLTRAKGYSRIDARLADQMVKRADRYHRCAHLTLNQAAARIAKRYGRSHEAVRQVLKRHDDSALAKGRPAVFADPGHIDARKRTALFRAYRRGTDLELLARRTKRSRGAVRRGILMARAEHLRELVQQGGLESQVAPTTRPVARRAPLPPEAARTGLGEAGLTDLDAFVRDARIARTPIAVEEAARAQTYHDLLLRAGQLIGGLDLLHPSASEVDEAETMLRWASRLKAALVRSQLRLMLDTLEGRLGRPLSDYPPPLVRRAAEAGVDVLADTVAHFDPSRGGRLAGALAIPLDRLGATLTKEFATTSPPTKRATALLSSGAAMPDWTRRLDPWQKVLEPPTKVRSSLSKIDPEQARLLALRFGWSGRAPMTLRELGKSLVITGVRIPIEAQRALAAAWRV